MADIVWFMVLVVGAGIALAAGTVQVDRYVQGALLWAELIQPRSRGTQALVIAAVAAAVALYIVSGSWRIITFAAGVITICSYSLGERIVYAATDATPADLAAPALTTGERA